MADGIYYNQEVTAEMLNGIALDLGSTSFNGFGTDKFGADELNKITADLVSAGILLVGNQCKVIRTEDGDVVLQDGIIVFANGAKKVVSEPLILDVGNDMVIYAYNNVAAGICTIESAEQYPTDGDYIKLATIKTDGTVVDNRSFSIAKELKSATFENDTHEFEINHTYWSNDIDNVIEGSQTVYKMPHTGFNYILLVDANLGTTSYYPLNTVIDLSKEGIQILALNKSDIYAHLYAEKAGEEIIITSIKKGGAYGEHKFILKLV